MTGPGEQGRSWPTGGTRVAGVIGDPIRHSLSPALHNAAFRAVGLDWVFLAFPVAAGRAQEAVSGMRALGIEGLSVTMPHKAAVAAAVDQLSPVARRLGAVNTVVRRGDRLAGESTDGAGFLDSLRLDRGIDPAGRRVAVIGAGGAARAVILALAEAGAERITVINRTAAARDAAAALAGERGGTGGPEAVADAEVVVNATPLGMVGHEGALPVAPELLHAGQVAVDLVYLPEKTPFLRAAEERGAVTVGGLGMLVHQAAHAFRMWTGVDAPVAAMAEAGREALGRVGAAGGR